MNNTLKFELYYINSGRTCLPTSYISILTLVFSLSRSLISPNSNRDYYPIIKDWSTGGINRKGGSLVT